MSLVEERGIVPVIVFDAKDLRELHGLTSRGFNGRDYLTAWLVGYPLLVTCLGRSGTPPSYSASSGTPRWSPRPTHSSIDATLHPISSPATPATSSTG